MGDSPSKDGVIPHVVLQHLLKILKLGILRDLALVEGLAAYQLVGEVTAHQGRDG